MTEFERGPLLWLPKTKELAIVVARPTMRIAGFYKIEAVDKFSGKRRVLADWFPNLITTNGANLLGANNGYFTTCCVGSGNTPPALTDTALQTLVGSTASTNSSSQSSSGGTPWYGARTIQYNFPAGTATGNLTEVGVGVTTTNLFSRALILDGGGAPTTITVLASEALYVTYQVNQYAPTADSSGNVTIASVVYAYVIRAANANSATAWGIANADAPGITGTSGAQVSNGSLGTVTGQPSGTLSPASSVANNSYSTGSFQLSGTATWGLTSGNVSGGISAALFGFGAQFGTRGQFQMSFSPVIPKDGSHILTLTVVNSWAINLP